MTTTGKKLDLMSSVAGDDLEGVRACIQRGIDVNPPEVHGWTPLRKACRHGNVDIVRALVEAGSSIEGVQGSLAVITAASWGSVEVLEYLIDRGIKIDYDVGKGDTEWPVRPIVVAASMGRAKAVRTLTEAGVDVNGQDVNGESALMTAWACNHPGIVRYLVENGAQLHRAEDWKRLALSPTTAIEIARGLAFRYQFLLREASFEGLSAHSVPRVKVDLDAICAWAESVPRACNILLDDCLRFLPPDAPARSDVGSDRMRCGYLPVTDWLPKECPALERLIPKDTGTGTELIVSCIPVPRFGSERVVYALANADTLLFSSVAVRGLLHYIWTRVSLPRFRVEVGIAALFFVCMNVSAVLDETMYLSAGMALVVALLDLEEESRLFSYAKEHGKLRLHATNWGKRSGLQAERLVRTAVNLTYGITAVYSRAVNGHSNVMSLRFMALASFFSWWRLIYMLRVLAQSAPSMGPMLRALTRSSSILLFFLGVATFMMHVVWLGSKVSTAAGNVHFADAAEATYSGGVFGQLSLLLMPPRDGSKQVVDNASALAWVLVASLVVGLVLGNLVLGKVLEIFDFEALGSRDSFFRDRAELCHTLFLQSRSKGRRAIFDSIWRCLAPASFGRMSSSSGYLWIGATVDVLDEKRDLGRLGFFHQRNLMQLQETRNMFIEHSLEQQDRARTKVLQHIQERLSKASAGGGGGGRFQTAMGVTSRMSVAEENVVVQCVAYAALDGPASGTATPK